MERFAVLNGEFFYRGTFALKKYDFECAIRIDDNDDDDNNDDDDDDDDVMTMRMKMMTMMN